eukprot:TRINITY_DN348_c0_g1_i1.p1 TRINITY_DN348_c0_g1~~TRINITY_DN348_c0_g1_i1.p1  ORF type:complete len:409 (-),score=148.19 TRINITY_DN348_c0_g1_i1:117-1313(-)
MTEKDTTAVVAEEPRRKRKSVAAAATTPAAKKTPAKAEAKTPAKAAEKKEKVEAKTPAKAEAKTPAQAEAKAPANTEKKTPAKAAKAEAKTPAKAVKTPAKAETKTPAKVEKKTPAKAEKKTPAKKAEDEKKPEQESRKRKAEGEAEAAQPPAKKTKEMCPAELRVHVTGFGKDTNVTKLREVFSACGSVTGVTLRAKSDKKRYALVAFATAKEAAKAVAELNGKNVAGSKLSVNPSASHNTAADVFVGSIPRDATEEWVKALFKGVATVKGVRIPDPSLPRYNRSKVHFAYVSLDTPAACAKAAAALNGKTVGDHKLMVHAFLQSAHTGVFVDGLPKKFRKPHSVAELFKKCGAITKVQFRPDGVHAHFSTEAEAAKAVAEFNGQVVDGATVTVEQD